MIPSPKLALHVQQPFHLLFYPSKLRTIEHGAAGVQTILVRTSRHLSRNAKVLIAQVFTAPVIVMYSPAQLS